MNSFSLVLDSGYNTDFYPENTLLSFTNFLNQPITFDYNDGYEVSVVSAYVYAKSDASAVKTSTSFVKWGAMMTSNFSNMTYTGIPNSMLYMMEHNLYLQDNETISHVAKTSDSSGIYCFVKAGYYDYLSIKLESFPKLPLAVGNDLAEHFGMKIILRFRKYDDVKMY